MSEKRKQRTLQFFPILVLLLGAVFTSGMFYHTYQQIAFEHISAFSEVMLEHIPEAEPQLLSALKEYPAYLFHIVLWTVNQYPMSGLILQEQPSVLKQNHHP